MWTVLIASLLLIPAPADAASCSVDTQGPLQVGDVVETLYETAHPYHAPVTQTHQLVRSEEIHRPGATYLAPHFSRFELAQGDYVIVRSPSGERSWRYEGYGKGDLGRQAGFWGIHILGDRLFVDLYSNGSAGAWGYRIDSVAHGFVSLSPEAICGVDDKENAQCYQMTDSVLYEQSRAVARLLINGSGLCTGWLVGSEGHLMTNNHCIGDSTAAMNTDFEFMAEGTCGQSCPQLQCDGPIVATTSTLVHTSATLDYTLVQLPVNPTGDYGYFQLRDAGPVLDERLYIPQHPGGRGKEIAVVSTDPNDASGFPEIDAIFSSGPRRIHGTYFGDTEGGSSGSPVVGHADGCVVVVHSGTFGCASLGNTGTVIDQVIDDLGGNAPADAVVTVGDCFGDTLFTDGFESGNTTAWSSTVN